MPFQTISIDKHGPIAILKLMRPNQGNAVDKTMLQELDRACLMIEDEDDLRAVILSGGSSKAFSIGWDRTFLERKNDIPIDAFSPLAKLPQPVICAIQGDALSAGLELALACDIRMASQEARFGFPETALGLAPMAGGGQRLSRAIGHSMALNMILTAEPVNAQEALRMGLVSQVLPRDKLGEQAEAVAETIASRGPIAVRYAKELVTKGTEMTLEQALRYELDLSVILQATKDRAEGLKAFLEKRQPRFEGR